MQEARS